MFLLPLVTVLIGVYRHVHYAHPNWPGMNSLALLLAAGFYFWQAVEQKDKRWGVVSGAILNVAVMLLWRALRLIPSKPSSNTMLGRTLRTGPNFSSVLRRISASTRRNSSSLRPE